MKHYTTLLITSAFFLGLANTTEAAALQMESTPALPQAQAESHHQHRSYSRGDTCGHSTSPAMAGMGDIQRRQQGMEAGEVEQLHALYRRE